MNVDTAVRIPIAWAAQLLGMAGGLVMIFTPLSQAIYWLYSGSWLSLSVVSALRHLEIAVEGNRYDPNRWLLEPQSWTGMHSLLNWMPLTLFGLIIFIVAIVIYLVNCSAIPKEYQKHIGLRF